MKSYLHGSLFENTIVLNDSRTVKNSIPVSFLSSKDSTSREAGSVGVVLRSVLLLHLTVLPYPAVWLDTVIGKELRLVNMCEM